MRELILHIGPMKTGSTALQQFFTANRELLLEQGVDYAPQTAQYCNYPWVNGSFLLQFCRFGADDSKHPIEGDPDQNLDRLRKGLSEYGRVLLSEEAFFTADKGPCTAESRRALWMDVRDAVQRIGSEKVRIVFYLRRHDLSIASMWKQNIKHGLVRVGSLKQAFEGSPGYCYREFVELVEECFDGIDLEICPRRYEKDALGQGFDGLFRDFCTSTGIDWDDRFVLPSSLVNSSISFDVAEAARILWRFTRAYSGENIRIFRPLLEEFSVVYPDRKGIRPCSDQVYERLRSIHAEDNAWISNRFFDGEALFDDDPPGLEHYEVDRARVEKIRKELRSALIQRDPVTAYANYAKSFLKDGWHYLRDAIERAHHRP